MAETIARQLASFIASCTLESLPPAITERAKLYILDTLGAMIVGAGEASSRTVADVILAQGGNGVCTVAGHGFRTSATGAALVNGTIAHTVEIDDDHRTSALHPGAVVLPAALAIAEHRGASGKALLEGVVAGYEVMTRLGDAFQGSQDCLGFHSTGTCGVFGAAGAAGRILKLDAGQLTAALGIAGSRAAGLQEWKSDGSWTKRLHAGTAAEGGVLSALLAARGYIGPETVIEGPHGFLKAFSGAQSCDEQAITRGLGTDFRGMATAFKPYACCRFSHPLIDAVLHALREHGLGAQDIDGCSVRMFRSGHDALFEPRERRYRPANTVDAQFSAPYIVAVSILHGPPLPTHFTESNLSNPELLQLAAMVKGIPDDTYEEAFPDRYPTHVTFHLIDGSEITAFEDIASGDPEKAVYLETPDLFRDEIVRKFRSLLEGAPAFRHKTEQIVRGIHRLEKLATVGELSRHLAAAKP